VTSTVPIWRARIGSFREFIELYRSAEKLVVFSLKRGFIISGLTRRYEVRFKLGAAIHISET